MREVLKPWQKRKLCEHGRTSGAAGISKPLPVIKYANRFLSCFSGLFLFFVFVVFHFVLVCLFVLTTPNKAFGFQGPKFWWFNSCIHSFPI